MHLRKILVLALWAFCIGFALGAAGCSSAPKPLPQVEYAEEAAAKK